MIKLIYNVIIIPFCVLWGSFYIASFMDWDRPHWFSFPYGITCVVLMVFSILNAASAMENKNK